MKFMQIKPQKARGVLKESMWDDPAWVAEEKFDGDRRIAQFDRNLTRFTGTRESVDGTGFVEKTNNLPHLAFDQVLSLAGTVLDGEIVAPFADKLPGGKSKFVTSIMGSSPAEAVRKQKEHGWLEYRVFDCLWFCGQDLRGAKLEARRERAKFVLQKWGNKFANIVQQYSDDKKAWFNKIILDGGEGVILKHRDHTYGNEKLWVKVKGEWTADVVIMGFEEGEGKYKGSVGAIVFGQYVGRELKRMGTCRGFTDLQMDGFTRNPKRYVGKVIRIKHNGREPTGAFRHPRWDGFRFDKNPKDCVYDPNEV